MTCLTTVIRQMNSQVPGWWIQWDSEDEPDNEVDEQELENPYAPVCDCGNCMYCLDLSWRDFM